jgi:hypothetical protein
MASRLFVMLVCVFVHCAWPGSNVSLTLYFLRFALGLNVILFFVWLALVVIPFLLWPPASFSWHIFNGGIPAVNLFQGYGLDYTFFLYGEPCKLCQWE